MQDNSKLIAFLNDHPPARVLQDQGETLVVRTEFYDVRTGEKGWADDEIPATLESVREWLGY